MKRRLMVPLCHLGDFYIGETGWKTVRYKGEIAAKFFYG
jgi:hypothetical protein